MLAKDATDTTLRHLQFAMQSINADPTTREALCVAVKPRMGNAEVKEALYPLFLKHGKPEFIRSDNGPEFIAENFQT